MLAATRTAVYLRVSTKEQNVDGQRNEVIAWLQGNGIDPDKCHWYTDKDSGKKIDREGMKRMRADIHAGRIKNIVVQRLDRISRNHLEGLNLIADWAERGIRIVAVMQQIDFSGTVGKMIASVLLAIGEIEYDVRIERMQAGIQAARARGVYKGRKPGTTIAKPERAKELLCQGLTPMEIGNALGVSYNTALRYLRNLRRQEETENAPQPA